MITNIYDAEFEEYLVFERGFDLDHISMNECIIEAKRFNAKLKDNESE